MLCDLFGWFCSSGARYVAPERGAPEIGGVGQLILAIVIVLCGVEILYGRRPRR